MALQVTGNKSAAQAALQEAIFLAEPEGYVRTFLDEGAALMPLLQELFWTTGVPEERRYVGKLLAASNSWEGLPRRQPDARLLSWRELEVLRLLPTHFDAEEIAERLMVSANTVRTHVRHIYRKLGVNGRSAAVSQAQQLHLI
jgi:LuxR family maltose regulon positive regulatory protein